MVNGLTLSATTDFAELAAVDTINICVPTPLRKTRDPDLSHVVAAVDQVASHLRAGQLVVLESTTYPGTVDEVVRPRLEAGGLRAGRDFCLAFSPERIDPGNREWTTRNIPRVVGGIDARSTQPPRRRLGLRSPSGLPPSEPTQVPSPSSTEPFPRPPWTLDSPLIRVQENWGRFKATSR